MINTLGKLGIGGTVIEWFRSYLTMRMQCTLYRGKVCSVLYNRSAEELT